MLDLYLDYRSSGVDDDGLDTIYIYIYISSSRFSGVDEDRLDTSCAGHVYIHIVL